MCAAEFISTRKDEGEQRRSNLSALKSMSCRVKGSKDDGPVCSPEVSAVFLRIKVFGPYNKKI